MPPTMSGLGASCKAVEPPAIAPNYQFAMVKALTGADAKAARLRPKSVTGIRTAALYALSKPSDDVLTTALRDVRAQLDRVCSITTVVARALREQNADIDKDAANVLMCASSRLYEQALRIKRLLGEDNGQDEL